MPSNERLECRPNVGINVLCDVAQHSNDWPVCRPGSLREHSINSHLWFHFHIFGRRDDSEHCAVVKRRPRTDALFLDTHNRSKMLSCWRRKLDTREIRTYNRHLESSVLVPIGKVAEATEWLVLPIEVRLSLLHGPKGLASDTSGFCWTPLFADRRGGPIVLGISEREGGPPVGHATSEGISNVVQVRPQVMNDLTSSYGPIHKRRIRDLDCLDSPPPRSWSARLRIADNAVSLDQTLGDFRAELVDLLFCPDEAAANESLAHVPWEHPA